ncbi:DUF4124 domain-containing protein [Mycobacterium malmoense]|uniref:DUF4124 domain-containing protein n=1 Tax=Mycobacterium malmoense TaxID=1780 RepID=UPI0034E94212
MRHERVERGVYRWVDDDGVTAVGDQPQHLDDTEHDVGNDRGAATSRSCHCQRREANSATASANAVP